MKKIKSFLFHPNAGVLFYIAIYTLISMLFLTDFPWVHSDESWLAGLSRNIAEHLDFSVTEAFFDAKPRYPHAIKILFHALQIVMCFFTGYSITPLRMISLIACAISLFFFYKIAKKLLGNHLTAFFLMVLYSFDIQFIYISHMARQESLLLLALTLCLYIFFLKESPNTAQHGVVLGIITGLSVGLHPNSLIIATTVGCGYLVYLITHPAESKKPLLTYIGTTGGIAAVFVALSYCFDSQFLTHYFSNGAEEFGITASPGNRLSGLWRFFQRLFLQEGGTYYVADIRLQLLLFLFVALLMLLYFFVMRKETEAQESCYHAISLLGAGFGVIAGIFLIGRFSQLSIVFLFPIGWLLTAMALSLFETAVKRTAYALLISGVCFISFLNIQPFLSGGTYEDYLSQISTYASPEDSVIGNLNMDFYFENGSLHDYRNLPYVMKKDGALDTYIAEHQIEYIFYSAELTYYFEHRPYYNALYGNIMFSEDLLRYCESECEYLGSFHNARYAPRILELIGKDEYSEIKVYKTKYAN